MKNIAKFLSLTIIACATICSAMAKDVEVKGYTKKDGTVVKGYTRHVKDKDATATTAKEPAKAETAVKTEAKTETKTETKADTKPADNPTTEKIKSYTKKDGTVVKAYTRKEPKAKK